MEFTCFTEEKYWRCVTGHAFVNFYIYQTQLSPLIVYLVYFVSLVGNKKLNLDLPTKSDGPVSWLL